MTFENYTDAEAIRDGQVLIERLYEERDAARRQRDELRNLFRARGERIDDLWVKIGRLLAELDELRLARAALVAHDQQDPPDLFDFKGVWYVRHADGTTEDIELSHGNLVEDSRGTCGQFLLSLKPDVSATPEPPPEPRCVWCHQPEHPGRLCHYGDLPDTVTREWAEESARIKAENVVPATPEGGEPDPHYPDHVWVWADGNYFDAVVIHREWRKYQQASAEKWEAESNAAGGQPSTDDELLARADAIAANMALASWTNVSKLIRDLASALRLRNDELHAFCVPADIYERELAEARSTPHGEVLWRGTIAGFWEHGPQDVDTEVLVVRADQEIDDE